MKTIKLDVVQEVSDSGQLKCEEYFLNDKYHNEYGPAIREWNESGVLESETYLLNGKFHNENGPAYRRWNESGVLMREEYWINNDKYHTDRRSMMKTIKLEVVQTVDDSGQLICESYWLNDKRHNENGPALRRWTNSGKLICEEYWLNDNELTKEEWQRGVNSDPCLGKVITVDGRQYKLGEV